MNRILHTLLAGIALLAAACGPRESAEDRQAIQSLLQTQFDRADARLTVDPIAVSDDHAVAGWTQGDTGGRALLKKRDRGWGLVLCAGDALLDAGKLQEADVPGGAARQLAQRLADAESRLSPERRAQLGRFQGVVRMDAHGHHPPAATAHAPAAGTLALDAAGSQLSFVSIKNNTVAEVHRFATLSGGVSAQGEARLELALDSVQTGIALRDQRLRELLFETAKFPSATVTLAVDVTAVRALAPGTHQVIQTDARLDLHGQDNRLPVSMRVTRTDAHSWLVTSEQPVIVNATNFGLINGVEALRKVVGLQAIGSGVPVTFALRLVAPSAS